MVARASGWSCPGKEVVVSRAVRRRNVRLLAVALPAGLLALAVGCRDGTAPLPVPSVRLEPDSVLLVVGQALQVLVVADPAVRGDVVLSTSAPGVAMIQPPATVIAATPGRAVIRAVLVNDYRVLDSLVVRVRADSACVDCGGRVPPSILAITDTAGVYLDPRALHGVIELRLALDVPPPDTLLVDFTVDGTTVCAQTAPPGPAPHACRLDTEEIVGGARRFATGAHVVSAALRRQTGAVLALSSQTVVFQAPPPATIAGPLVAIATSGAHTCAIAADGATYCWGDGRNGQLGNGSRESSLGPGRVLAGPALASISAGAGMAWPEYPTAYDAYWSATCGRTAAGAGYCWGYFWAVGNGSAPCVECTVPLTATPQAVAGGLTFRAIAVNAQGDQSCGVTTQSAAYCWGYRPMTTMFPAELQAARAFVATLGGFCAVLPAGAVVCSGVNRFGEAGVPWSGDNVAATTVRLPAGVAVDTLVASTSHVCLLTAAGEAWCWGRNDAGQLGVGKADTLCYTGLNSHGCANALTGARHVLAPRPFVRISAGLMHTCAIADDGSAWCWGRNHEGQLGSSGDDAVSPRPVDTTLRFRAISAGGSSTCGISIDGLAVCWGDNRWGQLGTGDRTRYPRPARVAGQGS